MVPGAPDPTKSPTAAPLSRRALAGAVDAAAVVLIAVGLVAVPWVLGGFALPMLGALVAILGWSVAPLVAFGFTPGMRLFGLEMIGPDGRRPDPIETAFRELLGRGLLPLSYLVVVTVGLAGTLLGRGELRAPGSLGLILVLASGVLALGAGLGHLLCLARDDRRSLADLVGRTRVVPRAMLTEAIDEDERAEHLGGRRRAARTLAGIDAGLAVVALVIPFVLGRPLPAHQSQIYADRLMRERAQILFEANPGDPDLARDAIERLERVGDLEGALRARERHRVAFAASERVRELKLRESLAKNPRDEESADALLELLVQDGRTDDARAAMRAFFEANPTPRERVRLGAWLQQHGFSAEAARELSTALAEGETAAEAHAYLGLSLRDLGRTDEARGELSAALALVPDWDELREALQALPAPDASL
jgi:uncharacterized RDD family membrane protein YckC